MSKDFLGSVFDDIAEADRRRRGEPEPEKGVKLRGKLIAGAYYIRAEDVADLLKINGLLPKTEAKLREAAKR